MTGAVISADGTTVGYRQVGEGPGVIVLHGGMHAAQHYLRLAAPLAEKFTVYLPDRRGRGLSGPPGADYGMARECEDIAALVAATGTSRIFGHSSGALIALAASRALPALHRVALYEPPFSRANAIPTAWVPRFEREIAQGNVAAAMVTAGQGIQLLPPLPRWLLVPLVRAGLLLLDRGITAPDVPMAALIPTQRFDMRLVAELADTLPSFATLEASVLLLGGAKSPPFLAASLDDLAATLPHVERLDYPDLDHLAPDSGAPERVGRDLLRFFDQPDER